MKAHKLAISALLACLFGLGMVWTAGSLVARPVNRVVPSPDPPGRVVRLVSSDGVALAGSYWPSAREDAPAVLLLHGINSSRATFTDNARWLNGLGYAVLAIDFRGHGGSGAAERTFGWREAEDARAGLAFLRREALGRKIGVIGVSLGGAAALIGPKGPLEVDALVLHAVYPDIRTAILNRLGRIGVPALAALGEPLLSYQAYLRYGVSPDLLSPVDGLRRFRGATLIIGGTQDRETSIADSRSLYASAKGPKMLWLVEGADHVEVSKLRSEVYRARLRRFFAATLGEPDGQKRRSTQDA